jgi:hypothetical protein
MFTNQADGEVGVGGAGPHAGGGELDLADGELESGAKEEV